MRRTFIVLLAVVLMAGVAVAELQTVQTGGSIRIRGNYYSPAATSDNPRARNPLVDPWITPSGFGTPNVRWTAGQLALRPIGGFALDGLGRLVSPFSWNDDGHSLAFVEQRTRLFMDADFTEQVSAVIEIDSYDIWGEDFRSDYRTGADFHTGSFDDVEIYQAYIEANEMWGMPLSLRIGRQEISLGNEWLIGVNDTNSGFVGLSFDAIRATYAHDLFSLDAIWAKLNERSPIEEDGDIDMYGLYGSYLGMQDQGITIDAYWLLVRDAISRRDTRLGWFGEWLEDVFNVDQYDPTYLHTIGLRGTGTIGAFDFEAEAAYQFGEADAIGFTFSPLVYGDHTLDFNNWGANLEVGYTFDVQMQPRVFLGFAYLEGEDYRDVSGWRWLRQFFPFYKPRGSVSFNRLFSNVEYSQFLDGTDLSNVWIARGGVSANVRENIELCLVLSYFEALEAFDAPWHFYWINGNRIAPLAALSFLTKENDDQLGYELGLSAKYHYTEDLCFEAGWAHFFVRDGLSEGNFNSGNGLVFNGGTDDDDADYLYVETKLKF